jgi:hypothetical protein
MVPQVLVKNSKKYGGMYVATKDFKDTNVVTSGKDMEKVYKDAKNRGIEDPVVFYVPKKGMVHVY